MTVFVVLFIAVEFEPSVVVCSNLEKAEQVVYDYVVDGLSKEEIKEMYPSMSKEEIITTFFDTKEDEFYGIFTETVI